MKHFRAFHSKNLLYNTAACGMHKDKRLALQDLHE
jgi:hypothetical protein